MYRFNSEFRRAPRIYKKQFADIISNTRLPLDWKSKLQLRRALRAVAHGYALFKARESNPPPSHQAKHLEKIEGAARRLLEACGFDGTSAPFDPQLGSLTNSLLGLPDPLHKMPVFLKRTLVQSLNDHAKKHGPFAGLPPPMKIKGILGETSDYRGQLKLTAMLEEVLLLGCMAKAAAKKQLHEVGEKDPHEGDHAINFTVWRLSEIYKDIYKREPAVSRTGPFARFLSACLLALGEHPNKAAPAALAQRWFRIKRRVGPNL